MKVAVIGGGIMGRGIALALAGAGHDVTVAEPDIKVAASLPRDNPRLQIVDSLEAAVVGAALVIEAVPENMPLKASIWTQLGELCAPDVVLASNTSALDIEALASFAGHPERVLGTHWFNPAQVVPCVEIVKGSETSEETIAKVQAWLLAAGKRPVVVKNSPGFVANRIQFALVREALLCLEEGLASAEEIDEIVSSSFGVRLAILGPLANADLGGLDTYHSILSYLTRELGTRFEPPAMLGRLVDNGQLGVKTGSGIYQNGAAHYAALIQYRDLALGRVISTVKTAVIDGQEEGTE